LRDTVDETAWRRLVQLYTPLLFYWARRCGQSEDDAADLVQEVFVALVRALPTFQYDPRGKFRNWLRTLMLNKLRDRKRQQARMNKAVAHRVPERELADVAEVFSETEYQQELSRRALRLMQGEFTPTTWKACWETVVQDRSPAEVARELGITENAVYIAKFRVLRKLRQDLDGLVD
jgi:RNA polymerase sigma-70 factor (ECF subfamily)